MRVLAGDIGGTNTRLILADCTGNACIPVVERVYPSAAHADLAPIVLGFLESTGEAGSALERACFAVAGPVQEDATGQVARITNLPWELHSARLAATLGIPRVRLINDFQGVGYGIDALSPADIEELQAGREIPRAPRVVIGAGTGLGQAILIWQTDHYEVYPTEGGHVDFAPTDERQIALLRELMQEFGRVSYERVVSGPGLIRIYSFLRDQGEAAESPELREAMHQGDPAAAISAFALTRNDPLASMALDLFIQVYGAQAGNLALTCLARGGVYIAGGIAPRIIERLRSGTFLQAFNDKGRMAPLTADMPVRVILNPKVGLLGAALAATRL